MVTRTCYRCHRRAGTLIGGDGAAWPTCTRHQLALLRTARRWVRSGINDSIRIRVFW